MKKIILLIAIMVLCACNKFKSGQCIQDTEDHFIWKISRIEGSKYIAQGYFSWWGNEVSADFSLFDGNQMSGIPRYVLIDCPSVGKNMNDLKK